MTAPAAEGDIVPTELDILCGKTKQIISHPGTIRYQRIVESYTQRYIQAESKFDKMSVTKSLYDYLKTTSRFLKFNDKTKSWEEITALAARDKVGHALRFAVNNINSDKKRVKSKRGGHRRVGSDFSAASITSINSAISTGTAATATSDGGPMVQSLMQQLSTNFNLAELQEGVATGNGDHPLKASNNTRKDHPLFGPSSGHPPRAPTHAHRRSNSAARNDHPLMAAGGGHSLRAVRNKHSHRRASSLPVQHPAFSASALRMDQPLRPASNTSSPTGHHPLAAAAQGLTEDDLNFLKLVNETEAPLHAASNHNSGNDLMGSAIPNNIESQAPPIMEVVTTPQPAKVFDGEMSSDFLSMLHEPIYEFDVDDANEDLH